jgi:hypothetical protein
MLAIFISASSREYAPFVRPKKRTIGELNPFYGDLFPAQRLSYRRILVMA